MGEIESQQSPELSHKTKMKQRGWKCMPYIIGNEVIERLASTGLTANLTVYMINQYRMKHVDAVNLVNIFFGTLNFSPLLGAFISDAYLGRYYTLASSSIISFLGMMLLFLSAKLPQFRPPKCTVAGNCPEPPALSFAVLYISFALLILGAGGINPCCLPFSADQFDRTTEKGRNALNHFFNWYYFTSTFSIFLSLTIMVYVQDTFGWPVGFGIPAALMLVAIVFFFMGSGLYFRFPPVGSPFSSIAQVFVAAARKRRLEIPADVSLLYNPPLRNDMVMKLSVTQQFRWLNRAAIDDGLPASKWLLCSVQQVEEVKCLIRIIPIWASGLVGLMALTQQWTFSVLQSLKMNRHLGPHFEIPPGSVAAISLLGLSLFIPVYDLILVPLARRFTKLEQGITLLQRQGIGLVMAAFSMVVAGLVEKRRRENSLANGGAPIMSALWLALPLTTVGVAEALIAVGQIEFFNRQFPEHMLTLAGALFYCSLAGSSYLSTFVVNVLRKVTVGEGGKNWLEDDLNEGRLEYFYYVVAGMGGINFMFFLVCAHFYRYKGSVEVGLDAAIGNDEEESMVKNCND